MKYSMESIKVKFQNRDDFFEVCAMLKRLDLEADGADVKYCILYFKKNVMFLKIARYAR